MQLHQFMKENREAILERSAATIRKRSTPYLPTDRATKGLPVFFDQVIDTLRRAPAEPSPIASLPLVPFPPTLIGETAAAHGAELYGLGFNLTQVVHIYGTICESVTQVADHLSQPIGVSEFNLFNQCLDDAVAQAVERFEHEREGASASREVQRLGFLAHELRNALSAAMMAFQLIQDGEIGFKGRTGQALERNLARMRDLIDRSLTEVRLRSDAEPRWERVQLKDILNEIDVTALRDTRSHGVTLDIQVEPELELYADSQMLVSAISNLVQNGLKFTLPGGTVSVRARKTGDRVSIAVEDGCGGLPGGKAEELSYPSARGTSDHSGVGLGVAICHHAIRLHGGEIHVRDLPGKGCVFTIDMPIHAPRESATPALSRV